MEIGEETKPLPSSPSLQAMESGHLQEEKTNTPLWRSKQEDRDNGESQPLLGAPDVEVIGRVRQDRGPNTFRTGLNKHSRGRWRSLILVAVLWITEFFISAAYSMIGPFFPEEAVNKGCSPITIGVIISASPMCVVLTSTLFGYLLPKIGLKFTLLVGIFLVGAAFLLMGFLEHTPSGWVFITLAILLRMTEGIGSAMSLTAIYTILPELYPSNVGMLMGIFEVGGGLGYAVGPPIGGLLYTLQGFMLPFTSIGSIILSFLPVIFLLCEKTSCKSKLIKLKTLICISSNFIFLLLLIGQVASFTALGFLLPTLPPFLKEQFGFSNIQIGLTFLSGPGIYVVLALLIGWLSDKCGTRYSIIVGFLILGTSFIFIGPANFISKPRMWITILSFGVLGIGLAWSFIPTYPDLLNIALSNNPDEKLEVLTSIVSGLSSTTLSLGEFIGPLIGGALTQITDFTTASMLFGQAIIAYAFILLGVTLINRCNNRLWRQ